MWDAVAISVEPAFPFDFSATVLVGAKHPRKEHFSPAALAMLARVAELKFSRAPRSSPGESDLFLLLGILGIKFVDGICQQCDQSLISGHCTERERPRGVGQVGNGREV